MRRCESAVAEYFAERRYARAQCEACPSLAWSEFAIHEAADGLEALELARRKRPSLVFLDIDLPVIDGIDACRQLRADSATNATTIVMLTAAREDEVERGPPRLAR